MSFTEALHKLGFSPIEANVYITLCKHGALTGYEVAKFTGISRSNVYAALYSLQDKGKCHVCEGETTKYTALSKEELLLITKREFEDIYVSLEQHYPQGVEANEPYITIKGYDNVVDKMRNCILLCQSHLYLMCSSDYISLLGSTLNEMSEQCRISIICEQPLTLSPQITTYQRQKSVQGFHMIIDTKSVLTGELSIAASQCLFSKNETLIRLMRESFITELDMIRTHTE